MYVLLLFIGVIFIPGLVWAYLDFKYGQFREVKRFLLLVNVFLFGVFNYAFLGILYALFGQKISFLDIENTEVVLEPVSFHDEIALAILQALVLSGIWLLGVRKKWLERSLVYLNLTKRFDEKDLFHFILNSEEPEFRFARIWDRERKIKFTGFIRSFCDIQNVREILLQDAEAYEFDGSLVSRSKYMYPGFPTSKFNIC